MSKFCLLGIRGDRKYESWRSKTRKVLKELELLDQLVEINEVDDILHADISAIPALLANNTLLIEQNGHVPELEEIKNSILDFLNQKGMQIKNILVPTDFSETAKNALTYATAFSNAINGHLKVRHVCIPKGVSLETDSVPSFDKIVLEKEKQMAEFVYQKPNNSDSPVPVQEAIETAVQVGFPEEQILEDSKEADLILMGTTGTGGVLHKIFGSISTNVAQQSDCPVLLIPPEATFKGIRNILYASNYESADEKMLERIVAFNKKFNAGIHFIHVKKGNTNSDFAKVETQIFDKLFEEKVPQFSFELASVSADSVLDGLQNYSDEQEIDLIVLVNRQRSFFENIAGQSMTRKMILKSKTPILVYHL